VSKRKRNSDGPYVAIPKTIMSTPGWRAMSPEGRLLWIELRGWLRNDRLNNGKAHLSCRKATEAIGLNKETIARRFVELEHFGFLRKTAEGFLGSDGHGVAAKYRFTDLAHGNTPANPRPREMGRRIVRLHPTPAQPKKTESRTAAPYTLYGRTVHKGGRPGGCLMYGRTVHSREPKVYGRTVHI
jgi:hypothetical protein